MNRMHKALENLKLEGQKASRVQHSRRAVAPRVAAAIRSKFARAMLVEVPSAPSLLFSAPLLAGHENDVLSVHEKPSFPVEVSKRNEVPKSEEAPVTRIAILGDDREPEANGVTSPEDHNNAVFASLAPEAMPTVMAAGQSVPADMLMQAIVLKRPTRTFRLDRGATEQVPAAEASVEAAPADAPRGTKAEVTNRATEWELESLRELADTVRYGQYVELLRSIRRDVRVTKSPVIAYCSIEADAQTADVVHRLATIAAKGGTAKVLVVDGNQAASRITSELNLTDAVGIIDALSRDIPIETLVRPTSQAGVFVVPLGSGTIEHLGNARKRLAALAQRWKQDYTTVLVDVGAMASPLAGLVSAGCDGAYVSIQLGTTLVAEAQRRTKQFRTDGVNLLGCIALQSQ